jgi:hypothetical protein
MRTSPHVCVSAVLVCALAGCAAVSDISGAVAGLAAGAATANPGIAIAVGIGVRAATREGLRYVTRVRHESEQDAIATAVAQLSVGEAQSWSLDRKLPGDVHGEVRVLRVIETRLTLCKEIAFSILEREEETAPAWFTTVACREGERWKWAAAEPAVDRWGNLQ